MIFHFFRVVEIKLCRKVCGAGVGLLLIISHQHKKKSPLRKNNCIVKENLDKVADEADVIVNCCGLGAFDLVSSDALDFSDKSSKAVNI